MPRSARRQRLVTRLERPVTGRRAVLGFFAVLALLTVALAAFGVAVAQRGPAVERLAVSRELQDRAGPLVAEVFTAGAGTWQADRERARTLVTPAFAASAATGLAAAPPAGVRAVTWTPLSTGVVAAHDDAGTALVVVRVTVTPERGEPAAAVKSVSADLVRDGDRWLLSGLDEL